jgi:hypothetical protein
MRYDLQDVRTQTVKIMGHNIPKIPMQFMNEKPKSLLFLQKEINSHCYIWLILASFLKELTHEKKV